VSLSYLPQTFSPALTFHNRQRNPKHPKLHSAVYM